MQANIVNQVNKIHWPNKNMDISKVIKKLSPKQNLADSSSSADDNETL